MWQRRRVHLKRIPGDPAQRLHCVQESSRVTSPGLPNQQRSVAAALVASNPARVRPSYGSLRDSCTRFECASCGGLHSNCVQECVEVVDKALGASIEVGASVLRDSGLGTAGAEQASRKWDVHALEERQEDQTGTPI